MMWRSLKQVAVKSKICNKAIFRHYSSESASSKSRKVAIVFAATGTVLISSVVYSNYDTKLKSILQRNVPYIDEIYKWLPDFSESKTSGNGKKLTVDLSKEKLDANKPQNKIEIEQFTKSNSHKIIEKNHVNKLKDQPSEQIASRSEKQNSELAFYESLHMDLVKQLESSCDETISAYEDAFKAIQKHVELLCKALNFSDGHDSYIDWKLANLASTDRCINAQEKASKTKALVGKIEANTKNIALVNPKHPLIKMCKDAVEKIDKELNDSDAKLKSVENEIKKNSEYQKLEQKSKELQQKLEIVLPSFVDSLNNTETIAKSDLHILIAHAHNRIEQLQKQLAEQQVTENIRLNEALKQQKLHENQIIESKTEAESLKRNIEIEMAVATRIASLKESFESELKNLLYFQAKAHFDHIQEMLRVHEQEFEQKHSKLLEEELLHMKGAHVSEMAGLMARLREILTFLKAKAELDIESRKAQLLWLSCQSLSNKISSNAGNLTPLEGDIASIKLSANGDNVFVNAVLTAIPDEALTRGVYSADTLKQRFFTVKKVCRKVAIINENNDSLFQYLLSYLQSCLIIDKTLIPATELEGKVAVDPQDWDTYDILSRITYSLNTDNLEQALKYANQLKGEARTVAKDWVHELRLLLETKTVVKALAAHAAAVNVQAYH